MKRPRFIVLHSTPVRFSMSLAHATLFEKTAVSGNPRESSTPMSGAILKSIDLACCAENNVWIPLLAISEKVWRKENYNSSCWPLSRACHRRYGRIQRLWVPWPRSPILSSSRPPFTASQGRASSSRCRPKPADHTPSPLASKIHPDILLCALAGRIYFTHLPMLQEDNMVVPKETGPCVLSESRSATVIQQQAPRLYDTFPGTG